MHIQGCLYKCFVLSKRHANILTLIGAVCLVMWCLYLSYQVDMLTRSKMLMVQKRF